MRTQDLVLHVNLAREYVSWAESVAACQRLAMRQPDPCNVTLLRMSQLNEHLCVRAWSELDVLLHHLDPVAHAGKEPSL